MIGLLVATTSLAAGCGSVDNSLSSAQKHALTARSEQFKVGLEGSNSGLKACVRKGGDTAQRTTCVAQVMDDAAGHVRDIGTFVAGIAASAHGSCKVHLDLFTSKLNSQAAIFTKAGQLARAQQIPAFKKTVSGIDGAGVATVAKSVEKACA
jgi:hypothetical protein